MGSCAGLVMKWLSLMGIDIPSLCLSHFVKVRIISHRSVCLQVCKCND